MIRFHLDRLPHRLLRPAIFFPLLAGLAVLSVYGIIQTWLAVSDRWEQNLAARMAYYRSHQPTVLVRRYEERLRAVRGALRKRGYDAGPTGTAMGPHTADALRSFQRRQGLPVTGRADQSTVTALGIEP